MGDENSACQILHDDPNRFVGYIIADKQLRRQIYNKKSMEEVARRVFKTDDGLNNIVQHIDESGLDLDNCLNKVFESSEITTLIKSNTKSLRNDIKKKTKKKRPELRGWDLRREIDKKLKRTIGSKTSRIKTVKQVTLKEALKPVVVEDYVRKGKDVIGYRRAEAKSLTFMEKRFIQNRLNLPAKKVIQEYKTKGIAQGYTVRTKEAIRKHYYRLKRRRDGKPLYAIGLREHL